MPNYTSFPEKTPNFRKKWNITVRVQQQKPFINAHGRQQQ